jgi:hypothetical protein
MGREIKRVALDFEWPIDKVWGGYLMPDTFCETPCPDCENGYSEFALNLYKKWYGNVPFDLSETGSAPFTAQTPEVMAFAERNVSGAAWYYGSGALAILKEANRLATLWNGMWMHHLSQEDVDTLVAEDSLRDLTHTWSRETRWQKIEPTPKLVAEEVNRWTLLNGLSYGSSESWVLIKARCEQAGVSEVCGTCTGHASLEAYEGQREEAENWEPTEPPTGEGWQVWETVSEGSPISPVFATREGLIRWLMSPAYSWGTSRPLTREQAESFTESAWAPSGFIVDGKVIPGDQMV